MLEQQFTDLEKLSGGILGVCATHIESNKTVKFNADQNFLMCSTYKVPMAIDLLHLVQTKDLNIDELFYVQATDLRPGLISTLHQFDYHNSVPISFYHLLKFMLQESCNTATDIILRAIGGPSAVQTYLKAIGIEPMRIDRYTLEILAAWDGVEDFPCDHRITLQAYKALEQAVSPENVARAKALFKADVQDRATPAAMNQLLVKLVRHVLLDKSHTDLLLTMMRGCKRGPLRLKGLLPPKTSIAHKTGTLTGYTCDVGIISLPYAQGTLTIAAYIKDSHQSLENNERVLAEVGRMLYDFFLY